VGAVFEPCSAGFLTEGAAAKIVLAGETIGYAGVLSGDIAAEAGLRDAVSVAEIRLSGLERSVHDVMSFEPLKRFPGVERDLAIVVGEEVLWADVERSVRSAGAGFFESMSFSSIYRGEGLGEGRKSVAFHVVFRSTERTLTGEEADADQAAIVAALERDLGASLR
jgi:phenylalanyl-tRNA synthetase beta chain